MDKEPINLFDTLLERLEVYSPAIECCLENAVKG